MPLFPAAASGLQHRREYPLQNSFALNKAAMPIAALVPFRQRHTAPHSAQTYCPPHRFFRQRHSVPPRAARYCPHTQLKPPIHLHYFRKKASNSTVHSALVFCCAARSSALQPVLSRLSSGYFFDIRYRIVSSGTCSCTAI